jgi:hypothetical protein
MRSFDETSMWSKTESTVCLKKKIALNEEDSLRMNFEHMVHAFAKHGKGFEELQEEVKFLFNSLLDQRYTKRLVNHNGEKDSTFLDGKVDEIHSISISQEDIRILKEDVEKLMNLFLKTHDPMVISIVPQISRFLSRNICEILNFIDANISHGIIKEISRRMKNPENFENQYKLMLSFSRIKYFMGMARSFKRFRFNEANSLEFSPSKIELIHQDYETKLKAHFQEFENVYQQIFNQGDSLSEWLKDQEDIVEIHNIDQSKWFQWWNNVKNFKINQSKVLNQTMQ